MYFLFIALFKRKHQMKLIEKLQKIDDTLRFNFKMDIDYSSYKAVSVVIMLTVLLYYDIVVSGVLYFYLLDIEALSALASFGVYIVQSGTSGVFTCGYVAYVILIKVRMIKLNEKLGMIVRFPPEVLEKQYKTKEALCNEMMRYTKMYKNLCSCVEDLNQMYGSSMVLHFAHDFTLLTTQIFVMFYIGFFDRDQSLPKILALMVWLAPNIVKMTFICFNCHMTKNEVNIAIKKNSIDTFFPSRLKYVVCICGSLAMKRTKTNFPISLTCSRCNQFISKRNFLPTTSSLSTCRYSSR